MKIQYLSLCILLFWISSVMAQNYKCINEERTALFYREYDYISALQIDSVTVENGDTIYYPMRGIREIDYSCLNPEGPSWIGDMIIVGPNGTNLFFNYESDTIKIYTHAKPGEHWEVYSNEGLIIEANVLSVSIKNFIGLTDSVKIIAFEAFNGTHEPISHPVESMRLWISKNFGLVRTPNFYFFPDHQEELLYESFGEYMLAGIDFPEAGIQNLTRKRVHDYDIGDELHILYTSWDIDYHHEIKTIQRFLDKTIRNDSVIYHYELKQIETRNEIGSGPFSIIYDTICLIIVDDSLFDHLPEDFIYDRTQYGYFYEMYSRDKIIKTRSFHKELYNVNGCWKPVVLDDCPDYYDYYMGLGGPYYWCRHPFGFGETERQLVYYKKGNNEWGTPLIITSVENETESDPRVKLYPNPAQDILTVEIIFDGEKTGYGIFDCLGKSGLLQEEITSDRNTIYITMLPPGLYFIRIFNSDGIIRVLLFSKN